MSFSCVPHFVRSDARLLYPLRFFFRSPSSTFSRAFNAERFEHLGGQSRVACWSVLLAPCCFGSFKAMATVTRRVGLGHLAQVATLLWQHQTAPAIDSAGPKVLFQS